MLLFFSSIKLIKQKVKIMKKIIILIMAITSIVKAQVTQEWLAVYDGPSGSIDSVRNFAVDISGNVYVTGSSTSSNLLDYTTLKYNSNGILLWEARYDGPLHFRDDAKWVVIDNSGNVYVTGYSRTEVQAGTEDYTTVKYNSAGVQQWAVRYDGPSNGTDVAVKVAVDNSGNVYVTGYSNEGSSIDYTTVKYNSEGIQQWIARYNGPGNSLDAPTALGIDNSGNVFVTGWSRSTSIYGSEDYLTIKYNSNGVEQWAVRYNGPSNLIDVAASLTLDTEGNVYVTGYSLSTLTQNDYVTIKYNSNGVQQWLKTYNNNTFNGSDMAKMVIIDNSGNVYVTGTSGTEYPFGYPNYVTIKYNQSGEEQWVSAYNGPGNAEDVPYSIALDLSGNVYVTGKTTMPGFFYDFATVKYSPNGNQVWVMRFNGASNMQDGATWVNVDNSSNVYVTGNSMFNNSFASDFVLLKYSQISENPVLTLSINYEANNNQDTITIELRNAASPYGLRESKRGLGGQGIAYPIQFESAVDGAPYYISVKHRNSIETWSKSGGEIFSNGRLIYNFTLAASQAFGNNMVLVNGKYSFYAGDVNQDGIVDAGDLSMLDNDAFNFISGYTPTNINGDDIVDGSDLATADNNAFNVVTKVTP